MSERLGILDESVTNTNSPSRYDSCPEAAPSDKEFENLAVRPLREKAARLAELYPFEYGSSNLEALATKQV